MLSISIERGYSLVCFSLCKINRHVSLYGRQLVSVADETDKVLAIINTGKPYTVFMPLFARCHITFYSALNVDIVYIPNTQGAAQNFNCFTENNSL